MQSTSFLRDIHVADRYQVSRSTIWRWVKNGKLLRPTKLGGGSSRWKLVDLEIWEHSQMRQVDDL